jgi:TolB-like protein
MRTPCLRKQHSSPKFEIGHVLFLDLVGYSKLNIDEQGRLLRDLNRIVQETNTFRAAETKGKLTRLPTGGGMALVFRDSAESPAQCALEVSRAVRKNARLPIRMGIHSGPVNELSDINQRLNLAGAGINLAQRVMDCGDAGHILLSKHVAEDLEHCARWQPYLHELGGCEVKHGLRIPVVNLCSEDFGNPSLPEKLKRLKEQDETMLQRRRRTQRRRSGLVIAVLILLASALALVLLVYHQEAGNTGSSAVPFKSIAVLPFENLSANPENAFFADGVQDEVLTHLAKIADLKVISRTSVMSYKSSVARNVREIGKQLGVAHILEGSVQRAGGRVRVNAQLIDTRNDTHLWAQTIDRELADLFGVQTEIAKTIADQLRAKLSPGEKVEIERSPITDIAAFDLYTRAKTLLISASLGEGKTEYLQAIDLLNRAVERDPHFFFAYCQLVHAHAELYFYNFDHTPTRRGLAEAALEKATHLRPDAGETHLGRAEYLYRCYLDYERARAELELAARALPNNSRVFALTGYIDRRQGRWEDAIRNMEKALEVDPRNFTILQQIAATYPYLRRFRDEALAADRILALDPTDAGVRISRAFVELELHGNVQPYRDTVHAIMAENPESGEEIASERFAVAWYQRDAAEATRAAASIPADGAGWNAVRLPRAWFEGLAARLRGDIAAADDAFSRARALVDHEVQQKPDDGPSLGVLGLIDAMRGRKEDAISEGRPPSGCILRRRTLSTVHISRCTLPSFMLRLAKRIEPSSNCIFF